MGPDVSEIRYSQNEANRVEDIRLATAIESGDGVELRVEAGNDSPLSIGLETIDDDLFDEHDSV